ncbi:MAG TPA: LuxR C-terminal-related transcriptional regulator [Phycisphaerae bacterium]|nr:LuxR C-terminal-related transcriptional regulator [Phycisphaerae bacterium]
MILQPVVFIVGGDCDARRMQVLLLESGGLHQEAFDNAGDFLLQHRHDPAGCMLLDMDTPGANGVELLERLRCAYPSIPIIVLCSAATTRTVVRAMKLGIVDFLEKPADPGELLRTVHQALEQDARRRARESLRRPVIAKLDTLTARERELLELLVQGFSSKQIAGQLAIAIKTVENHRSKLMQKMGAINIADLTRMTMIARAA